MFFDAGGWALSLVASLLVFFVVLTLGVLWGTHVAFHTWRRLEQRYPNPPPPPLPR